MIRTYVLYSVPRGPGDVRWGVGAVEDIPAVNGAGTVARYEVDDEKHPDFLHRLMNYSREFTFGDGEIRIPRLAQVLGRRPVRNSLRNKEWVDPRASGSED